MMIQKVWIFLFLAGMHVVQGEVSTIHVDCSNIFKQVIRIDENEKIGSVLCNISIKAGKPFSIDIDRGGYLTATRVGDFGIISLKKSFDYENVHIYPFVMTCETPGNEVNIVISNIIEGNITFARPVYTESVKEDVSKGKVIIPRVEINIADPGPNDFNHIQVHAESEEFFLQLVNTGTSIIYQLQLKKETLDYSVKDQYRFTATTYLPNYPDKNATAEFIINVTDVDNLNPKFTQSSYHINITENAVKIPVTNNLRLKAIDQDIGIDAKINYEMIREIPSKNWFSVNSSTGYLNVIDKPDREECSQLTLFVKGYQVDNKELRYDVTWVTITILDEDDNNPEMDKPLYKVSVPENLSVDTYIVQLKATDKDEGDNAKFLYQFSSTKSDTICNGLRLDPSTGMIRVDNSTVLDREKHSTLTCQVFAQGINGKMLKSNDSTVIVNLIDENDNNPTFTGTVYNYTIKKNVTVGHRVGQVVAVDKDLNPDIAYRIIDKSFKIFHINEKSGEITLNTSLKENFLKLYNFEVVASDGNKKTSRHTSVTVNINVLDVNFHKPEFNPVEYNITVLEDVAIGTHLVYVKATDKDPDDTLTFSLAGNPSSYFEIDKTSGMVSLKNDLDYEMLKNYKIVVKVSDSVHTVNTTVSVTVEDVNDNAPKFNNKTYLFTNIVEEKTNITIGTVHATDADSGENRKFTYSIETPWLANFSISNTGKITVIGELDRESIDDEQGQIKFIVVAIDHGHLPLTGTTEVTVKVVDANDNCPYFNTQDHNFTYVFKELARPHNFHKIEAQDMDKDSKNRQMKYTFMRNIAGFGINQTSGYLSATNILKMEKSTKGQISLEIVVSNYPDCIKKETAKQTIIIILQDVNRYPPQFNKTSYSFTLKEDVTVGSELQGTRITATDRDASAKYNTVTYWIGKGNDVGDFYMDHKTAQIYLLKPLDYEKTTQYIFTVHATDGHLYNSSTTNTTVQVTINVENVNDNTPKFDKDLYKCSFREHQLNSVNNCTVLAHDEDKGTNLSYSLNTTSEFQISKEGRIMPMSTNLDYDKGMHHYTLKVYATDDGYPKLTGTTTVEISILNVNDNDPQFIDSYNFTVMEDAQMSTIIGMIHATDDDGDDITYSLANVTTEFYLEPDTGLLLLNSSLKDKTKFTLIVHAKDEKRTGTTTVTVNIQDVNNHSPKFHHPHYYEDVKENDNDVRVVNVQATDKDNSPTNKEVFYSIETPWSENFTIDKSSGDINVKGYLDREVLDNNGSITFVVMATDHGQPPLTGTTEVTVNVIDVNDNCPYYSENDKEVTYVFNELDLPQKFHNFLVKDDDKEETNRDCHYYFTPDLASFGLKQDSDGFLLTTAPFIINKAGKKTKGVNVLQIAASNVKPIHCPNATQKVNIIVQDVNDHTPVFNPKRYHFSVKENVAEGKINNVSIVAKDEDSTAQYNTVHYGIHSGGDGNHFHIDQFTGDLFLIKQLDYETDKKYTLQITATDGQPFYNINTIKSATATVEITVSDVNDNTPQFDKTFYRCKVPEKVKGVISGCELKVTDHDTGTNGKLKLSVQNETKFRMQNISGVWKVDVVGLLDYDKGQRLFHLEILAEDEGIPSLNSSAIVEVTVTNVNDNEPYFINLPYNFTIPEDVEKSSLIGRIMAEDIDGDNLTYSIASSDFTVEDNGNLYTNADFVDRQGPVRFNVQVTDSNHTKQSDVTVLISDVNNNPPVFIDATYQFSVIENEKDREIGNVSATDKDEGVNKEIIYSLFTSEWTHSFTIDMKSGAISLNNSVDRELLDNTDGQITMIAMATDKGTPPLTGTAEVIIEVKDINDNCPYFTEEDQNFMYIWKELSMPLNFHKAVAYDKDSTGINKQITYKLTEGKHYFTVDSNGSLSATQSLRMETTQDSKFDIVIGAYNIGSCGGSGQSTYLQNVTVVLQDVNDHTPVFNSTKYHFSVKENVGEGKKINNVNIVAKDKDPTVQYNTVHYGIHSGGDGNHFHIDQFTGDLFLIKQLDYETDKNYTFQITATDGQPSYNTTTIKTATATVEITVTDVNDNTPQFDKPFYRCTVPENVKGFIPGCELKVTDHDTGSNGKLKLSVQNADKFRMKNISGVWKVDVAKSLDYDKGQRLFHLEILAEDEGIPPLNSSAIVEVTVTNVNDNEPYFINLPYNFTIPEDIENQSLIGRIMADDIDGDNLTYSITSSDFTVGDNGNLYTNTDFVDRQGPFIFEVNVTDSTYTNQSDITVHISDVNNNQPVFINSTYHFSVTENEKDREIGNVSATDKDEGVNKEIIYSLFTSEWTHSFIIDMKSGTISLNGSVDRELLDNTDGQITLIVMATDKGTPPLTGTAEVIIEVKDVNDNCPYFTKEDQNFMYIWKELSKPLNFHKAVAYDKDSTGRNNKITYSLTEGKSYFTVDSNGSLSATQDLTMEKTQDGKFDIVIGAYNMGPCSGSGQSTYLQNVTVVLQDVNNNKPEMTEKNFTLRVPENLLTGSSINSAKRISATDNDTSTEYNTVTYWMLGGNTNNTFHVDHYSGDIYLVKQLDYDEGPKSYKLLISAIDCLNTTDGQCNHSDTAVVNIDVIDVNDNPPRFTPDVYHCTVNENSTGPINNCKVTAVDKDAGINGNLTYQSLNSTFVVNSTGNINVNTKLDYESGVSEYSIIIQAIDKGNPKLTGTATVMLTVLDINDNPPVFVGAPYHFDLTENEPVRTIIGLISATDMDSISSLTFSLSNHTSEFSIDNSGLLISDKEFDFDNGTKVYYIKVDVSDGINSDQTTVVVTIININDNQPVFAKHTFHTEVEENITQKSIQVFSSASDIDKLGHLSYSIVGGGGNCSNIFRMDKVTGILIINNTEDCLDHDISPVHTLLIEARDENPFSHVSNVLVQINILDIDNKPPRFSWSKYTAFVNENEPIRTTIIKVKAFDNDTPDDKLIYKVTNCTEEFEFSDNIFMTKKILDAEMQANYTVGISVTDGTRYDYAIIYMTIEDVNDNLPMFSPEVKNFSIPANAKGNRYVGKISAKDEDISNDGFTFYLLKGDHFRIENKTGKLYVIDGHGNHQFEANKTYKVIVNVVDHGQPPLTNSEEIDVFIDITNHFAPKFDQINSTESIPENATINTVITTVTATDKDPDSAGVVWYKLKPDVFYDAKFGIDKNTGKITLKSSLDFEELGHYELTVLGIDKADDPKTGTTHVQIIVTDVNEKPHFLEKMEGMCIKSPISKDQLVAVVSAKDPDKIDDLTYSLTNTTYFRIGVKNGEITANTKLVQSNFSLIVIVKDKGGLMDRKEIDLYNNPSLVITPAIITVNIKENSTDHFITKVNAISNNSLTYSLFNTTGFSIHLDGTITSNNALDRETDAQQVVYVMVKSSSSSCQAQVNIKVIDINDNPPRFAFLYDTPTVAEDYPTGKCFFYLPVEDPDQDTNLTLRIIDDNSGGKFTIQTYRNQTGGCLMLNNSLDFDEMKENFHGMYNLTADVYDGIYHSTREIKVHVQDINDNFPYFNKTQYYTSISESVPTFTSIIHMTAHDKDAIDKGKLMYSLEGDDSVYFIIKNTTHHGDLLVNTNLDREQNSSYTVTVVAHDSEGHSGSTIVNITVLDVNDNDPSFINKSYVFTHLEGTSSVGFQMEVSTVDPDLGNNGTDLFTLSDTFGRLFNITTLPNNRGLITVMTALDRESPNVRKENGIAVFTLHVEAVDKGSPPRSSTAMVTLNVEDINDCVPQFGKSHYNATVLEGSPKGFSILTVTALDCDYKSAYKDISFSITGKDADLFEIDNDGLIKLATTISVQSHKNMFDLTIVANDSLNINKTSLSVIISDVNDHDPVFTYTVYNFTTPETDGMVDPDIVVGVVNATDEDLGNNGVITYSIISIDVKHLFNISQKGTITVIGSLDRDKCISSRYPFTVIARDNGSSRRTGYTEVIVYLTDINDNSPVFTQNSYNGKIQENSLVDKEVIILPPIYATDDDYGINGTIGIRYSLVDSNMTFRIDEISGRVFVNSSNLDREAQPFYSLQVTAADRNGTGREQTVNLTVTLLDVNDVPPEFSTENYTFYVNESAPAGHKVGFVMTTDDDVNGNITTRYRIASGSDGKFYVDILSGVIYTSGGLDREKKSEYLITLEAFDGQQKTDAQVYVYLEDANDNCPVFPQHNLVVRVPENTQNSTIVYNLTASDADEGKNGDITFYINSSETSLFVVYGDRLILNGVLDREKQNHYQFQVFSKDNGNPPCHVSSTMEIHVEDVNDNPPVFYNAEDKVISTSTATILEKSPVGSPILLPNVKDIDIDENADIKFSLQADKPHILNYFRINSKTGVVTIAAQVDLNSLNRLHILEKNATKTASLEMSVVATDSGVPPLSSNLTLTVVVEGINDQAPVFLLPEYNLTISENITIGSYVGNVEAVVENGTNYKLQYSLISNSNSEKYFTVAPISGNITTKAKIDREKTPTFSFAVQVKDGKIPERTAYTVVSVTVRDINDNCPEFKQKSYEYIVEENIPPQPLSILATDADEGQNGKVVYTLMDNEGGHFLLDEQTGMLSVNGSLNREDRAFYNLTVEAHDSGSPPCINSVSVMVIVTDQNDNKPKFSIPNASCKIKENEHPGTHVCDVTAHDPDCGLNGTVVYMFTGTSYQQFEIDPLDGSISTLVMLDYEEQSVYNLTIMAMDLGTPVLNSTTVIHIMVQDVYDTAPKFAKIIYDETIDLNTELSTIILSVNAGQYHVNYAIEGGNHGNHFDIDSSSGNITLVSRLGTSVHEYQLNVSATDGVNKVYAKVLLHVATSTIQKKNNTYTAKIQENVNTTVLLIDLNYTDGSNAEFHYELTQIIPDVKNTFELNKTTGQLYCVKQLDRENIDQYIFYIKVVTSSNRRKRSFGDSHGEIVVVVNVQDENDNPPLFNGGQQVMTIGIPDTTNTGDLITTLRAEDADISSTIKYSITGGNDKDSFDIDTTTGKVYSRIKVNSQKSYNIIVKATDGKQNSEIKILFLVISSFDKLVLTIPITSSEFERKQTTLLRNISAIVGFKFEMGKYDVHVDSKKKTVDLSSTDIYFHGINESTGSIVPQQTAFRIIYDKKKEIASLFDKDRVTVITYHTTLSPHKMSEAEIALLTIGVIIFLSCLLAIIAVKYTWNQFETVQRNLQDKIWELNSFHSSHTNGTIGAINSAYKETQFNTTEDQVDATNMKENMTAPSRREYESQEVILHLPIEPIEAGLHPPVEGGVREMSLSYDSGLENESNSTTSANENGQETRPENSAIRIETSVLKDDEKDDKSSSQIDKEQEAGTSRGQDVFIFEMETGDTDDNEIEEEGSDERIKRRKSSKKKRSSDLKVFSVHNETGDTEDDDIDFTNSVKRTSKGKKTSETKLQEEQESGELLKATDEEQTQVISAAASGNVTESNITDTETNSNVETMPNDGESSIKLGDDMAKNDNAIVITSF